MPKPNRKEYRIYLSLNSSFSVTPDAPTFNAFADEIKLSNTGALILNTFIPAGKNPAGEDSWEVHTSLMLNKEEYVAVEELFEGAPLWKKNDGERQPTLFDDAQEREAYANAPAAEAA